MFLNIKNQKWSYIIKLNKISYKKKTNFKYLIKNISIHKEIFENLWIFNQIFFIYNFTNIF